MSLGTEASAVANDAVGAAILPLTPDRRVMSEFPPEIQAFIDAVYHIGGIESVEPHKWFLPEISVEHFSLPQFADLPLGVMRRACGIPAHEVLVAFKIRPQRTERG